MEGFYADLMDAMGQMLNFTWTSHSPPDGNWGVVPLSGPLNNKPDNPCHPQCARSMLNQCFIKALSKLYQYFKGQLIFHLMLKE